MRNQEQISVEGVLGYSVPLIARLRVTRDALATGRVPLAHQTLFRSPAARVDDQLSVNEGASPSALGRALAPSLSAAADDANEWAVSRLKECGYEAPAAQALLEQHVAWHLAGTISFDEVQAINTTVLNPEAP